MAGEFTDWSEGAPLPPYDALRKLLVVARPRTLLEVGCGAGIYRAVVRRCAPDVEYVGCDYSAAMVAHARGLYPGTRYDVADQRQLPYQAGAFDLVLHGCCLIHLREPDAWAAALAEAARVADRWVVLHRTPVRMLPGWRTLTKDVYGVEIRETHVPADALPGLLAAAGLESIGAVKWNEGQDPEQHSLLCRKQARA